MPTLIAGLFPAAVLLYYIYKADHLKPEPWLQLRRAVIFGIGSIFVSLIFSTLFEDFEFYNENYSSIGGAISTAFFGAGLPEELAKLIMLYFVVRRNPYFDEKVDGIVYAVCVGMGFAGFENVMYLDQAGDDWLSVGVMRALMAVPCHYYCAVVMGFYYAKYWFQKKERTYNIFMALALPVLMHSAYDALLMSMQVLSSPGLVLCFSVVLFYLCNKFYRVSRQKIAEHLDSDARDKDGYQKSEKTEFYDRNDSI